MTYPGPPSHTPYVWHDGSGGGTPLNAADLMAAEDDLVLYSQQAVNDFATYAANTYAPAGAPGSMSRTITSPGALNSSDRVVLIDTSSGGFFIVLLPPAAGFNSLLTLKVINSNNSAGITGAVNSGALIDGGSNILLGSGPGCVAIGVTLVSDGTNWRTVDAAAPPRQFVQTSSTGNLTLDLANADDSLFEITNTGSLTLSVANAHAGASINFMHIQDTTGSRTVTWPSGVIWSGGAPTVSPGPNTIDLYTFLVTAVNGSKVPTQMLGHVVGQAYA